MEVGGHYSLSRDQYWSPHHRVEARPNYEIADLLDYNRNQRAI